MQNKSLRWLFILSAAVYFLQGIEGLPGLAISLWMKETLHLKDYAVQSILSWTMLAWFVKPIWGCLTDTYLSKKTWIAISIIGGLILCTALGLMSSPSLTLLIVLMVGLNWTTSVRDVSNDGLACVVGKGTGTTGKFQAIQWGSITIASIFAVLGGGYIADHLRWQIGYLALIPLLVAFFYILHKVPNIDGKKEKDYKKLLNRDFVTVCLFLWVYKTAPSFGTPLLYMKRDVFHWTGMQIAYLDAFVCGIELIGAWAYYKWCKVLPIKKMLVFSIFLGIPTTLCYLHFTPFTAWLYSALFGTIGMIIFLISLDFCARRTLTGLESTSFATMMSVSNFAGWCSLQLGSLTIYWWGLSTTIVISSLMGLIALPIVKWIKWEDK